MKKIFVFLSLFLGVGMGFMWGQNPPSELFDNWYYIGVEVDFGDFYPLEVDPPVNPTLIIEEDLSFHGEGACNSYSGIFIDNGDGTLSTSNFTRTNNTCEYPQHTNLDDFFISWFDPAIWPEPYYYTLYSNKLSLVAGNGFGPHFSLEPLLSIESLNKKSIIIAPNPASTSIRIQSDELLNQLTIYSVLGSKIIEKPLHSNSTELDISILQQGIYFIEILSDKSRQIQRFIKK